MQIAECSFKLLMNILSKFRWCHSENRSSFKNTISIGWTIHSEVFWKGWTFLIINECLSFNKIIFLFWQNRTNNESLIMLNSVSCYMIFMKNMPWKRLKVKIRLERAIFHRWTFKILCCRLRSIYSRQK